MAFDPHMSPNGNGNGNGNGDGNGNGHGHGFGAVTGTRGRPGDQR